MMITLYMASSIQFNADILSDALFSLRVRCEAILQVIAAHISLELYGFGKDKAAQIYACIQDWRIGSALLLLLVRCCLRWINVMKWQTGLSRVDVSRKNKH